MARIGILDLMLRLVAAIAAGGSLGLNRILHGKPTGFRTLALVSLGAALATLAIVGEPEEIDPNALSRVVQGILTGIGFLGAGVILRESSGHVTGLTTAATIWTTALLGIFCGLGNWTWAGVSTALALAVLHGGGAIERSAERFFKSESVPRSDEEA